MMTVLYIFILLFTQAEKIRVAYNLPALLRICLEFLQITYNCKNLSFLLPTKSSQYSPPNYLDHLSHNSSLISLPLSNPSTYPSKLSSRIDVLERYGVSISLIWSPQTCTVWSFSVTLNKQDRTLNQQGEFHS